MQHTVSSQFSRLMDEIIHSRRRPTALFRLLVALPTSSGVLSLPAKHLFFAVRCSHYAPPFAFGLTPSVAPGPETCCFPPNICSDAPIAPAIGQVMAH